MLAFHRQRFKTTPTSLQKIVRRARNRDDHDGDGYRAAVCDGVLCVALL